MSHHAPTGTALPTPGWTRAARWALGAVLLAGAILGWTSRGAAVPVYGDAAIYMSLAESLGHGNYRDAYIVGEPPHAQYPPGMAAWVLAVQTLTGGGLDPVLGANLLLLLLSGLLVADAVRRLATPWLGVAAAAIVVFNEPLLFLVAQPRAEVLFLGCASVALYAMLRDEHAPGGRWAYLAIAASIGAFLTRSAGVALLPAIVVAFLLRRRFREAAIATIAGGTVIASWFAYTRWAEKLTIGQTYAADFAHVAPASAPVRIALHAISNAREYVARLSAGVFQIPDVPAQPLDNAVLALLLLVPILIGAWTLRERWRAAMFYLVCSAAMLAVFPWVEVRFASVLLPWLVAALLVGLLTVGQRRGPVIAATVGALLAGIAIVPSVQAARLATACRASAPFVDPRCYRAADRSYVDAANYIRTQLAADVIIAASKPAAIHLLTGHPTLPLEYFARTGAERLLAPSNHATAIILSRHMPYEIEVVAPALGRLCRELVVLGEYPEWTVLLGVRALAPAGAPDACEKLSAWQASVPPYDDVP